MIFSYVKNNLVLCGENASFYAVITDWWWNAVIKSDHYNHRHLRFGQSLQSPLSVRLSFAPCHPQGIPLFTPVERGTEGVSQNGTSGTHPRRFAPSPLSYYERGGKKSGA